MNSFPRLLCLATLVSSAFAQSSTPQLVNSDPSLANENQVTAEQSAMQHRAILPDSQSSLQTRSDSNRVDATLPTATVLRLKLNRSISTATARPGERLTATLTRPVEVNGRLVIPSGSTIDCEVINAHGARRFAGKPAIAIKALGAHLPDGEALSFTATVVDTTKPHELDVDEEGRIRGASPNPMNKIETGALAGAGAVAGGVIAGPEGLLIGPAAGVVVAAGHIVVKYRDLTLPAGTELIFELDAPATTTTRPQMGGM